ncbi:mitochondrial ribonuclease III [Andalucia godoyi]|uniref:Mitochondrial ribonuclease III n=1 Tax=Andalucia godoyi TaxID=505711 RepID=A0A8K0F171_ANDGO|nr:mitochondrial ribonuclease III [Andalucia godoyi]|eukprot:ANDGO_04788.mRNA.1 mitochondrial ribonuclease III
MSRIRVIRSIVYNTLPQDYLKKVDAFHQAHDLHFSDPYIRVQPFLHPSYTNHLKVDPTKVARLKSDEVAMWNAITSNQRLELVGDASLAFLVSDDLFRKHPSVEEGSLTLMRENMIKNTTLYRLASEYLHLDDLSVHCMPVKDAAHERGLNKMIADAVEALLGAIYIDQGFSVLEKFVRNHILDALYAIAAAGPSVHPIPRLQTLTLKYVKHLPDYRYVGPSPTGGSLMLGVKGSKLSSMEDQGSHEVHCFVQGELFGIGRAYNFKIAKTRAAEEAIVAFMHRHKIPDHDPLQKR